MLAYHSRNTLHVGDYTCFVVHSHHRDHSNIGGLAENFFESRKVDNTTGINWNNYSIHMLNWVKHRMVLGVAGNCDATCAAHRSKHHCVVTFSTTTREDDLTR